MEDVTDGVFTKRDESMFRLWSQQKWLGELAVECSSLNGVPGNPKFRERLRELAEKERSAVLERLANLLESD